MLDSTVDVLGRVVVDVWETFAHNWPFLLISVVLASVIIVYVGAERLSAALRRKVWVAVVGAVVLASVTPFCSCGTTAVVLGALASSVPWAPLVAFMVSSPLTSPEEYVYSTGLFGLSFATTFFFGAVVFGLVAGAVTHTIEKTGWLKGQARMAGAKEASCCGSAPAVAEPEAAGGCCPSATPTAPEPAVTQGCCGSAASGGKTAVSTAAPSGPGLAPTALLERVETAPDPTQPEVSLVTRYKLDELADTLWKNARRLALYFFGFASLGYLIIELIPTSVLTEYLGSDSLLAVPLAALIGIPVYINSDGSLPLVATLMQGGMGAGPALAFLVTGAGTSMGAISGMFIIARAKVVGLVVALLFASALAIGWLAPVWL